ncbi:MAG: hypothetical protein ACLGGX_11735 [Bdellovibrionia bacterium]
MRSMSVSIRFAISILVFSIPLAAMTYYLYVAANEMVLFSEKEAAGVQALQNYSALHQTVVSQHFKVLKTNQDLTAEEKQKLNSQIESFMTEYLSESFNQKKLIGAFAKYLKAPVSEKKLGGRFLIFYLEFQTLAQEIADNYNIVLDPDLDTYYLMENTVIHLKKVFELYFQMLQITGGADEIMFDFQLERLTKTVDSFEETIKKILINLDKTKTQDANFYGELQLFQEQFEGVSANIREQLREVYSLGINSRTTLNDKDKTYIALEALILKNESLYRQNLDIFNSFLKQRLSVGLPLV